MERAVVAYAGRINPEKGLATVIEALGPTRSPTPVELCIAGVVEDEATGPPADSSSTQP